MTAVLLALALLAPDSGPFRYRFNPGAAYSMTVTEDTETTVSPGDGKPPVVTRQMLKLTNRVKVLSSSGGEAVLEERRVDGRSEAQSAQGKSESVLSPSIREIHISPLGKTGKIERKPIPGVRETGPGFLEGFGVPLPEKAVQPGASWSGSATGRGFDGRPVTVKYASRYIGEEVRAGRKCARLESTLDSSFDIATQGANPKSAGTLTGKLISWFAPDLGLDAEVESRIEITIKSAAGAQQRIAIIKSHGRQVLVK